MDYINKLWYGADVFSKPWRTVNWMSKKELEDSVKNIKPSNSDIGNVRILLHGVVGSGKSSFINSLNSVFAQRVITKVRAAPSAATSCTKIYKGHVIKIPSGTLGITIADFMGLEEKEHNIHLDDLRNALHGHLPDGYELTGNKPLSSDDPRYIKNPSDAEKTHCLVCVVSANSISRMLPATTDKMKSHLEEASKLGIPRAVLMTMGDMLCPAVKWDVKSIYMSKAIKTK
ncbi:interferon-induced protein 44-like, partial [Clarias magur]